MANRKSKFPHYPDGEVFELTLDGDALKHQPMEMVSRDGYDPRNWKHKGPKVAGKQTRRFKWVGIGYQPNFKAVRAALAKHGKIPKGQWREAVKTKFQHDGEHPRGIADASWVHPGGDAGFPGVRGDGGSVFGWAYGVFYDYWRWLVEVRE